MSQTEKRLMLQGREIILLGTAHISQESIVQVTTSIREEKPDCVAIELDEQRYASMKNPEAWKNLDIVKVLKSGQGFVLMANLVLSSFQKRMGADVGVKPGEEMQAAIAVAEELGIPAVMVDRPIQMTLKRAWAKNSLWGKCKLLSVLLSSAFEKSEITAEEIERLKNESEMDSMMNEIAEYLPAVKAVLIDERDRYLASHIWEAQVKDAPAKKIVAVLGAGHLPGVVRHLEALAAGTASSDTADISQLPPAGIGSKVAGLAFPVLIVALIAAGFFTGGAKASLDMLVQWILWNGSLAALGALVAGGHILTVLAGFVGAPLATLNPVVAVGLFTGLVQAWVNKPKVEDMEHLTDDATSLKGFYKNRILRVLLVFFLSSIGGVIGNVIAVPSLVATIAR
ncbi:MAG: TraB/GumN family protein [Spirochaetaceae bacterium]|nr:TraB/GumN family protein [Spirochaetaceae bacterium]MBR2363282.1 TraB/GumN family protein [Spirochaetaceae bacterium]